MKKIIIKQFILTTSIYTFVYLCKSFICFEFTNPFQWIINMPKYDYQTRLFILVGLLYYYICSFIIIRNSDKK